MTTNKLFNVTMTGLVMLSASFGFAQESTPCYGDSVLEYVIGTKKNSATLVAPERQIASRALGMPENDNTENFVSLGYGGSISIKFANPVMDMPGDDITVIETSYASNDCFSDGIERANVYLSQDMVTWHYAGQVCRNGSVDIAAAGLASAIAIKIENDASSTTFDGYDVDGVIAINGCTPPPDTRCTGLELVDFFQGTRQNGQPIVDPMRIDPNKALGVPQNDRSNGADNFVSLGINGYITLGMGGGSAIVTDGGPGADIRVYETTWGNPSCASYPEYALVEVSNDLVLWYSLGVHCQSSDISLDIDAAIPAGLQMRYIRVSNDSAINTPEDGFDVDGVEALFGCEPFVPTDRGNCFAECAEAPLYVRGTKRNGSPIAENRANPSKALGAPQKDDTMNFVSLGYGGSIVLCFDGAVMNGEGDDLRITETSFGSPACANYSEYADVSVSIDGITWYPVGTGCMDFNVDISNATMPLPFIYFVKISNNDTLTTTEDGYDVDGVEVLNGDCATIENRPVVASALPTAEMTAWPNPSKGNDVNFSFTTYETGKATLELFNLEGQLVSKIFSGQVNAGEEKVTNFNTSAVPTGIYMSRLTTANGNVVSGKVILAH